MNHPDKTNINTPDIENVNVLEFDPMPSPEEIHARLPLSVSAASTVMQGREALRNILDHKDHRLFVVVGPCSIHDPVAGLDYARRLKALADEVSDTLPSVSASIASRSRSKMRAGPSKTSASKPAVFTTAPSGASEPCSTVSPPLA